MNDVDDQAFWHFRKLITLDIVFSEFNGANYETFPDISKFLQKETTNPFIYQVVILA